MGPNERKVVLLLTEQIAEHGKVQLVRNPDGWGALPLLVIAKRVDDGTSHSDRLNAEIAVRLGKLQGKG